MMALVQASTGKWVNLDESEVKAIDAEGARVLIEYFGDDCLYVECQSEYHSAEERDRLARIVNGDGPEEAEA